MTREEAIQILQIYKDEIEQRIDKANTPDVKDMYRWQMDGFCMAIEALQREDRFLKSMDTNEPLYTEVVRCKDCIHYESDGGALMVCRIDDMVVDDTDYCSYGERKGGEDE